MAKYELVVIYDPHLEEGDQKTQLDRTKELIARRGGDVVNVDIWGKKKLAYPIRKKGDGYYAVYTFTGEIEGSALGEIERNLRLNESVLREMITRVPKPKPPRKVKVKKPRPATANVASYHGSERRVYPEARSAGQAGAAAMGEEENE